MADAAHCRDAAGVQVADRLARELGGGAVIEDVGALFGRSGGPWWSPLDRFEHLLSGFDRAGSASAHLIPAPSAQVRSAELEPSSLAVALGFGVDLDEPSDTADSN